MTESPQAYFGPEEDPAPDIGLNELAQPDGLIIEITPLGGLPLEVGTTASERIGTGAFVPSNGSDITCGTCFQTCLRSCGGTCSTCPGQGTCPSCGTRTSPCNVGCK
jgi:hypothetical protein